MKINLQAFCTLNTSYGILSYHILKELIAQGHDVSFTPVGGVDNQNLTQEYINLLNQTHVDARKPSFFRDGVSLSINHQFNLAQHIGRGKQIGRLIVISKSDNNRRKPYWLCKCECGNIKDISHDSLCHGTQSCGCFSAEVTSKRLSKKVGDITKGMWNSLLNGAISRNFEFNITMEYGWELFLKQNKKCNLTGVDISFGKTFYDRINGLTTASLDRIDSSKGYIEGNVQWVHKNLNRMKWDFDQSYFIEMCSRVYHYANKSNNSN